MRKNPLAAEISLIPTPHEPLQSMRRDKISLSGGKVRKEGCIRSSSPLPTSHTTLPDHPFPLLSGITSNNLHTAGPPTASPGLLAQGDIRGSSLHLHQLHAACTGGVSNTTGNNLHLHWQTYGAVQAPSLEEPSSTTMRQTADRTYHRIIGWKRPLRSSSPTTCPTTPCLLNHIPKCHIYTFFKHLQGWGLNHPPGQPGPTPDH